MRRNRLNFIPAILIIFVLACGCLALGFLPARASLLYGPPARALSISQRIEFSTRLLLHGGLLTKPLDPNGSGQPFTISQGESVSSVALRLQQAGIILDSHALLDYLIYTGLDLTIQSGEYVLSPALSIIDIARELQDATRRRYLRDPARLADGRDRRFAPHTSLDILPKHLSAARDSASGPRLNLSLQHGRILPARYLYPAAHNNDRSIPRYDCAQFCNPHH